MSFTDRDKLKALAIVKIFETGKPAGDYTAVAVLNDGAGVSYGINQFTHRSGSLEAVVVRFQKINAEKGRQKFLDGYERELRDRSKENILRLSQDTRFKNGLREMGRRPEMQQAQREIAFENYLRPAIKACEGSRFTQPLSLAVIYDSINHGSFEKIRDRVSLQRNPAFTDLTFEQLWITSYVQKRDAWLESVPRLAPTDYRTDFFLAQIARRNWALKLPVSVNGYRLTDADLNTPAAEPPAVTSHHVDPQPTPTPADTANALPPTTAEPPDAQKMPNAAVPTVTVDAPPPTGFLGKLKRLFAGLGIGTISVATIKEVAGIRLEPGTIELLRILVPTVLVLGFAGLVVWYISEKVVGFKTLRMQSEIQSDPDRLNIEIKPS